jgi:ArsR family transcriptional regulator
LAEDDARDLAAGFKALADPRRLTILDVLRKAAPEAICQCELTPLFPISQQALSKHMQVLTAAGMVGSERRGLWTFYYLNPSGIDDLEQWLR